MKKFITSISKLCDIDINIQPIHGRIHVEAEDELTPATIASAIIDQYNGTKPEIKMEELCLFYGKETVEGEVTISPIKNFEFNRIKIELVGEIVSYNESKSNSLFLLHLYELAPRGKALANVPIKYPFKFENIEKQYDSYRGLQVDLKYYLRLTIHKSIVNITEEKQFWVRNISPMPDRSLDNGIQLQVGLDKLVMLQIKYDHQFHECRGSVLEGKLVFHLVNVMIDRAEVSIKRKEIIGQGEFSVEEEEVLLKHEVIDGTPAKDEVVPIRIYLDSIPQYKLTPTCNNVGNKYSVQYFVHLALCDMTGKRYFKQREIKVYRSKIDIDD